MGFDTDLFATCGLLAALAGCGAADPAPGNAANRGSVATATGSPTETWTFDAPPVDVSCAVRATVAAGQDLSVEVLSGGTAGQCFGIANLMTLDGAEAVERCDTAGGSFGTADLGMEETDPPSVHFGGPTPIPAALLPDGGALWVNLVAPQEFHALLLPSSGSAVTSVVLEPPASP